MIQVNNVSKSYNGVTTINGITFSVDKGEIVGFLGPNGAGKTTTMRIITGYLPPSSGSVKIAGYDVMRDSIEARRHIGYLPESVPLYLDLTVNEYLQFFAKIMRVSRKKIKQEIEDIESKTGLTGVSTKIIGSLSRGYKQRVGIAQALIGKPSVLILDEPTVGLDPVQIIEIRELIKTLAKNQTVILSTHILPEVQQICDRVLIINKGSIVADGKVDDLVSAGQKKNSLRLTIGTGGEEALGLIKKHSGVVRAELKKINDSSEILVESAEDIRHSLLRDLINKNVDLLEFKSEKVDLESVFLKLVTNESK